MKFLHFLIACPWRRGLDGSLLKDLEPGQKKSNRNTSYSLNYLENLYNTKETESIGFSYPRCAKLYKMMGEFLGTRDGIQCRSHHVKQLRTHRRLKNIIVKYRKRHEINEETLTLKKLL